MKRAFDPYTGKRHPIDPELVHLVYASAATRSLSREDLLAILEVARRRNEAVSVTGILLYVDGTFFQVLEGGAADVEAVFERIGRDERHSRVLKLIREPIPARAFPDWTMGYAALSRADLESIPGLSDFFRSKSTFVELQPGRARDLLAAFVDGRWRANVLA